MEVRFGIKPIYYTSESENSVICLIAIFDRTELRYKSYNGKNMLIPNDVVEIYGDLMSMVDRYFATQNVPLSDWEILEPKWVDEETAQIYLDLVK